MTLLREGSSVPFIARYRKERTKGLDEEQIRQIEEAYQYQTHLEKRKEDVLRLIDQQGMLDEALRDRVHLYVLNFLKILCEKGTLRELSGCARAYRVRYNQAHGILEATATTAVAMTEQQAKSLHEKLEKLTGKTIDLKTKVDPAVLGGIRLDIEGTELDGTVQNRLAALRRDIASVTL